jgi:hypothetical protein
VPLQVEDVHHAFPDHLTFEGLSDGHGLGKHGAAGVLRLHRFLELIAFCGGRHISDVPR